MGLHCFVLFQKIYLTLFTALVRDVLAYLKKFKHICSLLVIKGFKPQTPIASSYVVYCIPMMILIFLDSFQCGAFLGFKTRVSYTAREYGSSRDN